MITSRPNVVVIPLSHDSLIISYILLYVSSNYAMKIKLTNFSNWWLFTVHAVQALYIFCKTDGLLCCGVWVPLYRASTITCVTMRILRLEFNHWYHQTLNRIANGLQFALLSESPFSESLVIWTLFQSLKSLKAIWLSVKPRNKWNVCVILYLLGLLYHSKVARKAY